MSIAKGDGDKVGKGLLVLAFIIVLRRHNPWDGRDPMARAVLAFKNHAIFSGKPVALLSDFRLGYYPHRSIR